MRTAESYEKADIKKYLDSIGAWYTLTYTGGFGKSGAPDIVACINGRFWGIEIKREGKEPTKIQTKRMDDIRAARGLAVAGTAKVVIEEIQQWHRP